MSIKELMKGIDLAALTGVVEKEVKGVYISDMISDLMNNAQAGNLWITSQTHKNMVSAANLIDISAVIIPGGKEVPRDTVDLANRFGINILSSKLSSFDLAARLVDMGVK